MTPTRRSVLTGLLAAPMLVRTPGLLMPVRALWTARELELIRDGWQLVNGMWWKRVFIQMDRTPIQWMTIAP